MLTTTQGDQIEKICHRHEHPEQAWHEQLAKEGHFSEATFTNPSIFRVARYLLTQDDEFEVQGTLTGDEILISVSSD